MVWARIELIFWSLFTVNIIDYSFFTVNRVDIVAQP